MSLAGGFTVLIILWRLTCICQVVYSLLVLSIAPLLFVYYYTALIILLLR